MKAYSPLSPLFFITISPLQKPSIVANRYLLSVLILTHIHKVALIPSDRNEASRRDGQL